MKLYAKAKYVFIYNYYLPVSSCNKRKETKVIQLWHASGLQKKFGYDAKDDLGGLLFVRPTKNYDLAPVSSKSVQTVVMQNWRLTEKQVPLLGSSRTDALYNIEYIETCRREFFSKYPMALNKKIILWAPSFRGADINSELDFIDDVVEVMKNLPEDYFFIIKLHPHLLDKAKYDNCTIPADRLNGIVDLLITDYSSIFYDFLINDTQTIFYIPDYEEYKKTRGLYIKYEDEFQFPIVKDKSKLLETILSYKEVETCKLNEYKDKFIKYNDGNASKRILEVLFMQVQ